MTCLRRLVDWPWVTVEVECSPCHRAGRYRLARLAERLGCEFELAALLHVVSARCTIPRWDERTRQYEARCGVRYRIPAGGCLPDGLPAREVRSDEPPLQPRRSRRLGTEGPLPTVGDILARGITRVLVHCHALNRHRVTCHHTAALNLTALALRPDLPLAHIPGMRRLRCQCCGGREASVMPDWPKVRSQMVDPSTAPVVVIPGVTPTARDPALARVIADTLI